MLPVALAGMVFSISPQGLRRVVWDEERSAPLADLTAKLRKRAIWGHGGQVEGVRMTLCDMREIELIQQIEGHALSS